MGVDIQETPLGDTAIGWVLAVILLFLGSIIVVYMRQIAIPAARQRLEIDKEKALQDIETQKAIAQATSTMATVVQSIDKRLEQHSDNDESLKQIHEILTK